MNKKYKKLAQNTVLFTISSFGSKILSFLLVPLYTSILTTADYGIADILTTSVSLLVYVLTFNISSSVLRFAMDDVETREDVLAIGLKISLLGGVILSVAVAGCYFLKLFDWQPYCYFFLVLLFLFTNLNDILNNYLRAIDKITAVVISGLLVTGVTITCNIIFLVILKWGVVGYLLSSVLGLLVSIIYCFIVSGPYRLICKCPNDKHKLIKQMLVYSIPMSLNGMAWWISASLDKYFIIAIAGVEQNGLYAVASKISTILNTCMAIFLQAWGLSAIKEYDKEDKDGFFSETHKLLNSLMIILCSFLILINVPLANGLFSKEFFEAWKCSSILLISAVLSGMGGFVGSVFAAVKDSKSYATSTIYGAIVNVVLNIVLIPQMGITGAATATAVSFAVVLAMRLYIAKKYINWKVSLIKDFIGYVLLALQVIFEHMKGHMYLLQVVVFVILILIYRNAIFTLGKIGTDYCKKILKSRRR